MPQLTPKFVPIRSDGTFPMDPTGGPTEPPHLVPFKKYLDPPHGLHWRHSQRPARGGGVPLDVLGWNSHYVSSRLQEVSDGADMTSRSANAPKEILARVVRRARLSHNRTLLLPTH